jgi:predicted GNAT superfamily acetyltransferase
VAAVVPTSALTIREAASPAECGEISALFTSIWGGHQHIPPELGRAIVESGGYVVAARRGDVVVGASVGIVGQSRGPLHLHSHITGVVPSEQRSGVGLAIKRHQREWARARGMSKIVWTFDPLVRRNALFNLARLGARATRYEVDFYGPVRDAINGEDDTDRLVVEWATSGDEGAGALAATDDLVAVPTPADIVALRATDAAAARAARQELREALGGRMASGWTIEGVSADGSYLLRLPS